MPHWAVEQIRVLIAPNTQIVMFITVAIDFLVQPKGQSGPLETQDTGVSHEVTLSEEEISDVSLATFYVFDNENAGTFRRRISSRRAAAVAAGAVAVAAVEAVPAAL